MEIVTYAEDRVRPTKIALRVKKWHLSLTHGERIKKKKPKKNKRGQPPLPIVGGCVPPPIVGVAMQPPNPFFYLFFCFFCFCCLFLWVFVFFVMCQDGVALLYTWSYFVGSNTVLCLCVTISIKNPNGKCTEGGI